MNLLFLPPIKRKIASDITASRVRVIYELIQGLIKRGHKITVLGTKDSVIPGANLIPIMPKGFLEMPPYENSTYAEISFLTILAKETEKIAHNFDIIHNHTFPELINLFIAEKVSTPVVTTIHAQPFAEFDFALSLFKKQNLVAISKSHAAEFKKTKFAYIVNNGIDLSNFPFQDNKQDYLLWLGRMSKAKNSDGSFMDPKGIKWAIKLAQETNENLILAGSVEDLDFFNQEVKPHLNEKIKWYGPINSEQKISRNEVANLMGKAKAFLMTINWKEPFGLVMIEAMATGTPVIGFNRGAVKDVILPNKTGFIVEPQEGILGLKNAIKQLNSINYKDCRNHVLQHFSIDNMVKNYENVYQSVINKKIV